MPGQPTTAGANIALDAMSGRATQTARTTYLAFLTAAPTDTTTLATMAEVFTAGTNGYSRPSVTWTAPTGDPSVTRNSNVLSSGTFTGDPASVTHVALVSAATGTTGDLIYYWTLDTARDAAIGDRIEFAANALEMTAD